MKIKSYLFLILFIIVILTAAAVIFASVNLLPEETITKIPIDKYAQADKTSSEIGSRKWMNYAMSIVKRESLDRPTAARFYSYVASVYADVLKAADAQDANLATAEIINILIPGFEEGTKSVFPVLNGKKNLSKPAEQILEKYKTRIASDNFSLRQNKKIPEGKDKWYVRNGKIDASVAAGNWEPWILAKNEQLDVPQPPESGSIKDQLELEKVSYVVNRRTTEDDEYVYFWHSSSATEKASAGNSVTPAGVWQNILYVELTDGARKPLLDQDYADTQKLLAEIIADSYIASWQVKYQYLTQRPSMRIPNLDLLLSDPPFPGYISDNATASSAAAVVLTYLFPEKEKVWTDNLRNAANSRIIAGVQFDADNKAGEYVGAQIGEKAVQKLSGEVKKYSKPKSNLLADFVKLVLLKLQPKITKQKIKLAALYKQLVLKPTFINVVASSGVTNEIHSTGAAWADYDNDGDLDLFVGGRKVKLYRNNKGKFADATQQAGLASPHGTTFAGVFGDYDNDGCLDLFLSNEPSRSGNLSTLYHSNCNGTFTDVTQASKIIDTYHGRGAAWADYDNDGFLDLYVVNQGEYKGPRDYRFEPNILFHNNRDGTFVDVTEKSGADGFIGNECPNINTVYTIKVTGKGVKASLQPIWFDYNLDGKIDLFIATDSGISPLYRNNGDGTFKNVTSEAGMCKLGTGMGVTAGDYDNDQDLDIYITNVGVNYLWSNNGDGTFTEKSEPSRSLDPASLGWGAAFIDYDNDGLLDIYVVNGRVQPGTNDSPDVGNVRIDKLYRNLGNGVFSDVATAEGIIGDDPKEGAAIGDYDNNGFEDIFVVSGYSEITALERMYKNKKNSNHWLTIKLVGTKSNKDAVGALVTLKAGPIIQMRQIISGSSYLSQNSLWPTFGLGTSSMIDEVKIKWPSGTEQTLKNIKADQKITITENQ
ncbi:MAG TPA: FG-GAP-like repeat-containing protein [Patescibacteria group bacterium]|nr:FG-GAP-like repeat-containing protein [Patescibacteria group bacterium]